MKTYRITFNFNNAFGWTEQNTLLIEAMDAGQAKSKFYQLCLDLGIKFKYIPEPMIQENIITDDIAGF